MTLLENFHEDEITGINITPLVDVMLVLLVIFMVTTSYIDHKGIKLSLPQASTAESTTTSTATFSITADAQVYLNDTQLDDAQLTAAIATLAARDKAVTIAADRHTPHGKVITLIDKLRRGGITAFAITALSLSDQR